jgi:hypothetical protein
MKKTILLFAITIGFFAANAQKGSIYVGGQLGFGITTDKETNYPDYKTSNWNIAPEVGTFLKDNLSLGFALNLSGTNEDNGENGEGSYTYKSTRFAPVIYVRRFYKVGDKFSTFVGLVGSITTGSATENDTKSKLSGGGVNLSIGAAYALSARFTAVGQYGLFGYTSEKTKYPDSDYEYTTTNFGLNVNALGPVLNVGIYYTFKE